MKRVASCARDLTAALREQNAAVHQEEHNDGTNSTACVGIGNRLSPVCLPHKSSGAPL